MSRRFVGRIGSAVIGGLLAILIVAPAQAGGPVNKTLLGNAIDGYDPVAWHLLGMPIEGSRKYTFEWMGATWRFANSEHRDLFATDPETYAPAFGGYCAYGVSQGAKVDFDPDVWRVVDGQLYLNLNRSIQKKWEVDIPGFIAKANQNWPKLRDK